MSQLFGLEHEFGLMCINGSQRLPVDPALQLMLETQVATKTDFLPNGGRLYRDVGEHPEYATPECSTLVDLVTHEKAGERLLEALAISAEQKLRQRGLKGSVFVFKNNTDFSGVSFGAHENYLYTRNASLYAVADDLMPFLVTRQLLVGAGKVLTTGSQKPAYCLSQRGVHMSYGVGQATMRGRAIISTRGENEPHADRDKYRRLHIIVGDSNMSETTTALKVGSTSLMLRAIEHGVEFADLRVSNPARALREGTRDLDGSTPVDLVDGRSMTALEIQHECFTRAHRYADAAGILDHPDVAPVVELWARTLRAIDTGDRSLIERDIDWAIKLRMIESYSAKHSLTLDSPRIQRLDLSYHDVRRSRGLYYLLEKRGDVSRFTTDLAIYRALNAPPPTRAAVRGDFLKWAAREGVKVAANWSTLTVKGDPPTPPQPGRRVQTEREIPPPPSILGPDRTVHLLEPLQPVSAEAETLKRETPAAAFRRKAGASPQRQL